MPNNHTMQKAQPEIFFSYAWGGEAEAFALALYESLQKAGYKGVMDRYAVDYKESFTDFMKRIGRGSFIIVLVNDKYLKSDFCMFEFLEIFRKSSSELNEMGAKLLPIVFNDAKLRDFKDALAYANFWKEQANDLDATLTDIGRRYTTGWNDIYKVFDEISTNIGDFAKWLRGRNTLTPDKLAENDFAIIKQAIAERANWLAQQGQPLAGNLEGIKIGAAPFVLNEFVGRQAELEALHNKLFAGENMLLLVNGEGGVGKTSMAARYYAQYGNYYHYIGWVSSDKNIANALLQLAPDLGLTFTDDMDTAIRLEHLITKMAKEMPRPCLLVIDNANELDDLSAHSELLQRCPNFHILLTSRLSDFEGITPWPVGGLPLQEALQLFTKYYPKHSSSEDALFAQIHEAVNHNTLVVELMAKNLKRVNYGQTRYTLADLLNDLQQRGLLALTHSKEVKTPYKTTGKLLRKENPEKIIAAMYDMEDLSPAEKKLLSVMAVLPAENIAFGTLRALLPQTEGLEEILESLAQKGWLAHNEGIEAFKISPVIQEITRAKNSALLGDCEELIIALVNKLDYDTSTGHFLNASYQEAMLYARYGEAAVGTIAQADDNIGRLLEYIGRYHQTTGNLPKALALYEQYRQMQQELCNGQPDNVDFKNGLAISYSKLGQTYADMGNLPKALQFYEQQTVLFKQLFDDYPDNVGFKNGLAIAYEKLGQTYADMGNLPKALQFYEDETVLFKQLFDDYPDNVGFKNGLAISYSKLGQTYASMGNLPKALQFYELDADLSKQLFDDYPDNVGFKNGLAISYIRLGLIYEAQEKPAKAREFNEKAKVIWQQLVNDSPEYAEFKNNLEWVNRKLA